MQCVAWFRQQQLSYLLVLIYDVILNMLAVVMRAVYKDMLLLTMEERILDYGELRSKVSCICNTASNVK